MEAAETSDATHKRRTDKDKAEPPLFTKKELGIVSIENAMTIT